MVEISERAPVAPAFGEWGDGCWHLSLLMEGLEVVELDVDGRCDWPLSIHAGP
jgi:hypothetical protein